MAKKILIDYDFAQNNLNNARIQNLSAAPGTPKVGQIYFDTTLNQFGVWNGTSWLYLTGSSGTGNVTKAANSANTGALQVSGGADKSIADISTTAGIVKVAATGVPSVAVAGTDYLAPNGSGAALTGITEGQVANLTTDLAAKAPTASPTFTGTVTVPTPVNPMDASTKAYVDATAQGLDPKQSVLVATTANITLSGEQTIDGVTTSGSRVLVKNQTTASANGVYLTSTGSWVRTTDANSSTNLTTGAMVFVEQGTTNGGQLWVLTTTGTITIGTTSQTWSQFSGASSLTAGNGLTASGNVFNVGAGTGIVSNADSVTVDRATNGSTVPFKYSATVGDGTSTSIAVTHGLGTQDCHVQVRDASTNAVVECDITMTSTTVATLGFAVAPAANAYRVVIIG